jgi:nucleoside-diphosphate-sugar epimerase
MNKSKILITGGNGFIGSYLRNVYVSTNQVFAPGHSVLDLTNRQSVDHFFETHSVDVVIHCALAGRDKINAIDPALVTQNLEMFNNLWRNRHRFKKLINMGTGNEFDTSKDIDEAPESELHNHLPIASYGYAKNIVARLCEKTEHFYNLRLFGIFHCTENSRRFFKRLKNATDDAPLRIYQDHRFDFVNIADLVPVIDLVMSKQAQDRDINVVYKEKRMLSEHARMFADLHHIPQSRILVEECGNNNFTGDGSRLAAYNLPMAGLEAGFAEY